MQEPIEEVACRHREPTLMEVREDDDVAGVGVRLVFVAGDDPL
jgi:hypothetical protein